MISEWSEVTIWMGAHFSKCKIKDSSDEAAEVTQFWNCTRCVWDMFSTLGPQNCVCVHTKMSKFLQKVNKFPL